MTRSNDDLNGIHFRDGVYYHDISDVASLIVGSSIITAVVPIVSASISVRVLSGSTATLTLASNQHYAGVDATAAEMGVVLPSAASSTGKTYTVKKLDVSANKVLLSGASTDKIWSSGTNPTPFIALKAQGQTYSVISDGYVWHVCGFYSGTANLSA
jgi:hypothetical protein